MGRFRISTLSSMYTLAHTRRGKAVEVVEARWAMVALVEAKEQ